MPSKRKHLTFVPFPWTVTFSIFPLFLYSTVKSTSTEKTSNTYHHHHHHPQSVLESLNKGKSEALLEFTATSELDAPYSYAL